MTRQEFGDWQTPIDLARLVVARVSQLGLPQPSAVLEPTCGVGSFLVAAAEAHQSATLHGYELNASHARAARERLPASRTSLHVADFFDVAWEGELARIGEPVLVVGNPPWVTNSILGAMGSNNVPVKSNFKGLSGYDALTGKSNFDVSEWMILRLLNALQTRRAALAMLCKTGVARRVLEFASTKGWAVRPAGLWRIDAAHHFQAAVDAALFVCETGVPAAKTTRCPVFGSLGAASPLAAMAVVDNAVIADADKFARTAHLAGACDPVWRSGLKHDCSRVMELELDDGSWRNGHGEHVRIESALVFPFLKSSDVANGAAKRSRAVIVPQRALKQDTAILKRHAPKAWDYLTAHREELSARKSSIYRGQPEFAIFGIGAYSFAPWKVAISGLYKRCAFTLVGPQGGRPVMLDDTCYFLPFDDESAARRVHAALQSNVARDFFDARIFWDAKRPINKAILQQIDLNALLGELCLDPLPRIGAQQMALSI